MEWTCRRFIGDRYLTVQGNGHRGETEGGGQEGEQEEAKGHGGGGGGCSGGDGEGREESERRQWAPVGGQSCQSDLATWRLPLLSRGGVGSESGGHGGGVETPLSVEVKK